MNGYDDGGHPAVSVDWYYSGWTKRYHSGWTLYRGSGMLSSVAVVNDASTTTRDVPGIHVATGSIMILEQDENGGISDNSPFVALSPSAPAPESHEAHFKALTNVPRSMLALTTCHAWLGSEDGPAYTCAGAGIETISAQDKYTGYTGQEYGGRSSIRIDARANTGEWKSTPDYLTSKIWARYPRLAIPSGEDPDGSLPPYKGQLLDFKLSRSAFVADCNAATIEVCNKAEEQCQPFLCTQEVKTYKGPVEAFGLAFANYGLATAVLMPLFALLAARIGRKPAKAAGETAVSVSEKI